MATEEEKFKERLIYPFTAFNFSVEINKTGGKELLCAAAFSDCDGLEITMDVKTIREGGNNGRQIRLTGAFNYGQVTLKRGMTANFDLWDWVSETLVNPSLRAEAQIVLLDRDRQTELAGFVLSRCLPTKIKAPTLNAKDGMVAIEELQLTYESLTLQKPPPPPKPS
ncbi:MAG TPA: phage tail protein [Pyrinomonadaceae bacterium]|nr:phage tail protein [Pyrinomonadaceae bacterium]